MMRWESEASIAINIKNFWGEYITIMWLESLGKISSWMTGIWTEGQDITAIIWWAIIFGKAIPTNLVYSGRSDGLQPRKQIGELFVYQILLEYKV